MIDWKSLKSTFGTAEEVPYLIRRVIKESEDGRPAVYWKLEHEVVRGGEQTECAPYAARLAIE